MKGPDSRTTSFGEISGLSALDRFGVWLSKRQIQNTVGSLTGRDFADFAPRPLTMLVHKSRAALSLAISMKTFMPTAQKKDRRGAKRSMSRPAAMPARI